jgi:hypothetical protein
MDAADVRVADIADTRGPERELDERLASICVAEELRELTVSALWRWPSTAYGVTFSSAATKWVVGVGSRPAPETPLFASTTAASIRRARASGASARIVAVE